MSWIVGVNGQFGNGRKMPSLIGPFMSDTAARRCVDHLARLGDPKVPMAVQVCEAVTPVAAYAAAGDGVDLAYGGKAVDQWSYDDPPPTSWGGGDRVEAPIRARGMSVAPLDADGKPIETQRRFV